MTRDEILEAAAQIFGQKGYHATSMSDIASAVNLQKASLYHHINSKQEILLSLLDEALDILTARMNQVLFQPVPVDQKLKIAMEIYLETLADQRDLAAILLLEHRSLNPELQVQHLPRRDRFESLWRDLIQMGVDEEKFICKDVPMTTRAVLGVMTGPSPGIVRMGRFRSQKSQASMLN
jgi:AcrR family transcriptional regulator